MVDSKISPIGIATAGVTGAAALTGINKAKKMFFKKYAGMPADSFIKRSTSFIEKNVTKENITELLKTSKNRIMDFFKKTPTPDAKAAAEKVAEAVKDGAENVAKLGKFANAKKILGEFIQTQAKHLADAKTTITKNITEFATKHTILNKIKNVIKSPVFIGALVGIGLYITGKKIIDKLQNKEN